MTFADHSAYPDKRKPTDIVEWNERVARRLARGRLTHLIVIYCLAAGFLVGAAMQHFLKIL